MITINENYLKLQSSYLFSDIAKRVRLFHENNPDMDIIKLGIGDVTLPLPPACISAMHKAVDDMANVDTFRGYGPEQGYDFLRNAVAENDFKAIGADISPDEIFISDGSKCDIANIQELLSTDIIVAIPDPVYPVYVDTNVMAGRTGGYENHRYKKLVYLECTEQNNYVPDIPEKNVDLIYLCFPNNPTGVTVTRDQLKKWVDYAKESKALILYDSAYVTYIRDNSLPKSIYEIPGARDVAIEFRSFSKSAGFTGTRCAYTVVPQSCFAFDSDGKKQLLHPLWNRRHTTKFNGVAYPIQRAAEAVYSEEGKKQVAELTDYYLRNALLIREEMSKLGYSLAGGKNAPYIWIKTDMDSWAFFDLILNKAGVVITPGSGFGACGAGYIRISAFNDYNRVREAIQRIHNALK